MAGYKIFMILPFTCSMSVTTLVKHCKPGFHLIGTLHQLEGVKSSKVLSSVSWCNVLPKLDGRQA